MGAQTTIVVPWLVDRGASRRAANGRNMRPAIRCVLSPACRALRAEFHQPNICDKKRLRWSVENAMKRLALATVIAVALTSPALAQSSIAILTGSTSGVYYPLGNAISAIFLKTIPGARSNVQVTQGSVENLQLLEDGDGELAFSLGDSLSAAWKGNAEAGFRKPLSKLRGVAAIYRNYVQLVVSEASGIKSLADLKGKRVSVGPKQSGTELNARAIFTAAGLSY